MLRTDGDPQVRNSVETALANGEACWCQMVQLELWNGARGGHEKNVLMDFARTPTGTADYRRGLGEGLRVGATRSGRRASPCQQRTW